MKQEKEFGRVPRECGKRRFKDAAYKASYMRRGGVEMPAMPSSFSSPRSPAILDPKDSSRNEEAFTAFCGRSGVAKEATKKNVNNVVLWNRWSTQLSVGTQR